MSVFSGVRRFVYRVFYTLPSPWRRRLVRLAVPSYAVGAVALIWDADADAAVAAGVGVGGGRRLLLVRQPPGLAWSLPAGLLDRGERPIDGCVREVGEETGLRLRPEEVAPAVPNAIISHRGRWVDVVFEARVPADTPTRPDGFEVLEVAWHRVDALPPVTHGAAKLLANYGLGPYADYPEVRA